MNNARDDTLQSCEGATSTKVHVLQKSCVKHTSDTKVVAGGILHLLTKMQPAAAAHTWTSLHKLWLIAWLSAVWSAQL